MMADKMKRVWTIDIGCIFVFRQVNRAAENYYNVGIRTSLLNPEQ